MTNTPESIDGFYHQLSQTLRGIPFSDKIILMGEFNARVGDDFSTWKNVIGKYGSCKIPMPMVCVSWTFAANSSYQSPIPASNISQLIRTCGCIIDPNIGISMTISSPVSVIWRHHETRAMRGADCNTDHIMIRSSISLIIKKKMKRSIQPNKKLNVSKLKNADVLDDMRTSLNEKLRLRTPGTAEDTWKNFQDHSIWNIEGEVRQCWQKAWGLVWWVLFWIARHTKWEEPGTFCCP